MKAMHRLLAFGVAFAAAAAGVRGEAVERTFPGSGASATVRVDPARIDPAGEAEAVVSLAASAPFAASVPSDLSTSFEGFSCLGAYTDAVGAVHLRLAPDPAAARWRVRPIAVRVVDSSVHPATESWFATEPIALPAAEPAVAAADSVAPALAPDTIRPSLRHFLLWILVALAAFAAAALLALLARKLRRVRALRRLSPRERALRELGALLARGLPGAGRFKDYYVELTMVVRRYIERRYAIRAPKLTTEQFLAAAKANPAFPGPSVAPLGAFLEAADLVKFAGVEASRETADAAAARARAYLEAEPGDPAEADGAGPGRRAAP